MTITIYLCKHAVQSTKLGYTYIIETTAGSCQGMRKCWISGLYTDGSGLHPCSLIGVLVSASFTEMVSSLGSQVVNDLFLSTLIFNSDRKFAVDTNSITKCCPEGILIVTFQIEGFPTFSLCLTIGHHLSFTENYETCEADSCPRTPPRTRLQRSFAIVQVQYMWLCLI